MNWEQWLERIPYNILINILVVVVAAAVLNLVARRLFERNLRKAMNSERRTGIAFLRNAVTATIFVLATVAVVYSIPAVRSLAVGFFAGASILAAIIGFASQKAFSNIVSGIFIVLFKPFRVDDIIKIGGEIGTIEDITLRHTVIRALENKRLIYPNSVIDTEAIINWSIRDEKAQKFMFISIDFESDLERAEKIIVEVSRAHKDLLDLRTDEEVAEGVPLVDVQLLDFNGSMVNYRVPLWARDLPTAMRMTWEVQREVKRRFDQEGIHLGRPSQVNYQAGSVGKSRQIVDTEKES
ncbi:mechanosensitive ion channel [Pelagicoccus sp. SDUM812003]|nr:mechanosensitive ion channel [Pelagicoccus sp. SDUM812003]